eukprot:TRINITY_DN1708_c0_g1_i1.p1 TRINITY_DN1708_c0_g1~~TRINITY_DN1708_c0_g1_i1.p1  ORF type:complete len:4499 (-),score=1316.34 TRINITY_DN1708_c0_g1_i1:2775-16271(-)
MEEAEEVELKDERVDWIQPSVLECMKLKLDRWKKFLKNLEFQQILVDFMDQPDKMHIVFFQNKEKGDELTCSFEFPSGLRKKGIAFCKKKPASVDLGSIHNLLFEVEIGTDPLAQLRSIMRDVYLPLIEDPRNTSDWPRVVAQDVIRQFHKFVAQATIFGGKVNGQVQLPIPNVEKFALVEDQSYFEPIRATVHAFESAIVDWTREISRIIEMDSSKEMDLLERSNRFVGPMMELSFWQRKNENLGIVEEEIQSDIVRKIIKTLEVSKSSFLSGFDKLVAKVSEVHRSVENVCKYLDTLRDRFSVLEECQDVEELDKILVPIIHTLLLIWKHCPDYARPGHFAALLRMISNDVVRACSSYLDGSTILRQEIPDALEGIRRTRKSVIKYKHLYFAYKGKVGSEMPENAWRFDNSAIFWRVDKLLERLDMLETLLVNMSAFDRLEKVEIGGTKGQMLTSVVIQVLEEYRNEIDALNKIDFDTLNLSDSRFVKLYTHLSEQVDEYDKRLCNVISRGFEECSNANDAFRLLEAFETQMTRRRIREHVDSMYSYLLALYEKDVEQVIDILKVNAKDPPVLSTLPKIAGILSWCRALGDRVEWPIEKLREVNARLGLLETPNGESIVKKYDYVKAALRQYEENVFHEWSEKVQSVSLDKLDEHILVRLPTGLLKVNFDVALSSCIQEVRYFQMLSVTVPEIAEKIFSQREEYRQYIGNLNMIVSQYNTIQQNLIEVERPLVREHLEEIDTILVAGFEQLTWKSQDIPQFIDSCREKVRVLYMKVNTIKGNVRSIEIMMEAWKDMFTYITQKKQKTEEKKKTKLIDLLAFWRTTSSIQIPEDPQCEQLARKLFSQWREKTSMQIHGLSDLDDHAFRIFTILENIRMKLEMPSDEPKWKEYLHHVSGLVAVGICDAIRVTLDKIVGRLEAVSSLQKWGLNPSRVEVHPLLITRVALNKDAIAFAPTIQEDMDGNLQSIVEDWVQKSFKLSKIVKRLDDSSRDYSDKVGEDPSLEEKAQKCRSLLERTLQLCSEVQQEFEKFDFLYKDDREAYLASFLAGDKDKEGDDVEDVDADSSKKAKLPPLESFEERINHFQQVYENIQALPSVAHFGWLRVDVQPLRSSLSAEATKWRHMFLQFLSDNVENSVKELVTFIQKVSLGLQKDVPKGNYDKLVAAMGLLLEVRSRTEETDSMFDPLKETVALLKRYGRAVDDDILQSLENLPEKWSNVKKLCVATKEKLASLQVDEVKRVQRLEEEFSDRAEKFRMDFFERAPFKFSFGIDEAYNALDVLHVEVTRMEKEVVELQGKQRLFELMVNSGKQVKDCRQDLMLQKTLWDTISLVMNQLNEWKQIAFLQIDTEYIEDETKKFQKELRLLDKRVRVWNAFGGLESTVKNFMTSLPLVSDLRSPSMRDRHWNALMKATGVKFDLTADFKLQDLLALELHRFVEEVEGIVERASKEMNMEKALRELERTWAGMCFDFGRHKDTDIPLIRVSEDLVETLEDNQVQLQNMSASKYIAIFEDDVEEWLKTLGSVDTVISLFMEVQHTWAYLENIFIGSEDIRKQLPEDSRRFDGIDVRLKQILRDTEKTPKVVEACCKPGLEDALTMLQEELAKCEKSLSEYLEVKRKAFPRFYFVSVPDLLDILSKGGQSPHDIMFHMPKLFQAIQRLEFEKDENGKLTKIAKGMQSKEGEYVPFHEPCDCSGQVEVWLNRVVDHMRESLRRIAEVSVVGYEEKTRESWLIDYPAQIVLLVSQSWWAAEVFAAFAQLEEGNENALKDYNKKQIQQLFNLIHLVGGELEKGDRQKVMCLVTLDVHARDIVANLVRDKIESAGAFAWQGQLRPRWDEKSGHAFINICDAEFQYGYEYLGNGPRLVITPLTDRIYITATQSLHLTMGCAPAGPAGTGKTETTKDLGSQIGKPVYVFNCSDQMDYKSLGNIFKGLASSGSWGCFDEFNRIAVEVLSVVSTQFKSILDAIREHKDRFNFQGEDIVLDRTCGVFITMNPGYLGRTELPESLKALFRPVTVVVPDFELIAENMLMAEGFLDARRLAKKFITLYSLNRDLLSKQDHYDWGLRAIKAVLVVAGSLRRAEPQFDEESILMRALRDFNLPKIVADDVEVFMGLMRDLFPGIDLPRKRDMKFEEVLNEVILEKGWQAEDGLILKAVQLRELFEVRHSVFVLGVSGVGKTVVWKSLAMAQTRMGMKTLVRDLNPKSITSNELYGHINPSTREWEDGLLSSIMRDLGRMEDTNPKWIVLDGDLDTEWIESMNSVMDDNKILTLASNERIPLLPHMRMLFEIAHLRFATPATVSRAGILYVSDTDIGWLPYIQSWIDKREDSVERSHMTVLVDKYIAPTLVHVRRFFRSVIPITDMCYIETICRLLDYLLQNVVPGETDKEIYELYFVFACVWAFGGSLTVKDNVDYRVLFSRWWKTEFKTVKFPESTKNDTVFDYYIKCTGPDSHKFERWEEIQKTFEWDPELPIGSMMVPTVESTTVDYFLDVFLHGKAPLMLCGNAGTGKTKMIGSRLVSLPEEKYVSVNVNFNYYTDARSLQTVMEGALEKKAGRNFGPPGTKRLVYFIDDLNMPYVDQYGTQSPIALMRQYIDYSHWYDRKKWSLKEVQNCQFVAGMNPTAGSFEVNPRLQRHFSTIAIGMPSETSLAVIYGNILGGHLTRFAKSVAEMKDRIVKAALFLHKKTCEVFLKTAIKFHYEFNLRHLANVFEGLLKASPETMKEKEKFVCLWAHESSRVYCDRLVDWTDKKKFDSEVLARALTANFGDFPEMEQPNIFSSFSEGLAGDKTYNKVRGFDRLREVLDEALTEHNEERAVMNLVLFEDAMQHVCRICRIIENPSGHALLVGVGGSGKQSLSRLAAFIVGYDVFQITISRTYGIGDLKEDLKILYQKAGKKGEGVMFLFTDSQIVDERFLVYLNDLLSSGNIPDLFAPEEKDDLMNGVRSEAKQAGIIDTRENLWAFFIEKVKRNLHVVLCFSPVGDSLRVRARKFPALVNCTVVDWFQPWPKEALLSVATRFLMDVELGGEEIQTRVVEFMATSHESVDTMGAEYLLATRRHTYTTPKSFLEYIAFYKNLLSKKRKQIQQLTERLENGLIKLQETASQVADLEEDLKVKQVVVAEKKANVDKLLKEIAQESAVVQKENEKATEEELKCNTIQVEVSKLQQDAQRDLDSALPALQAAEDALNTLNKKNLTELKSFPKPPKEVERVMAGVMILLSPGVKDLSWGQAQRMMGNVDNFLKALKTYDKNNIPPVSLTQIRPYVNDPEFTGDFIRSKSFAAAGICDWAVNIVGYYDVYCDVEPKRKRAAEAKAQLDAANTKLRAVKARVAELQETLTKLENQYKEANDERMAVQKQAERTQQRLDLAQRLVGALASENVRWADGVKRLEDDHARTVGDVLLASAFVSYLGGYSMVYRRRLVEKWRKLMEEMKIPCSDQVEPVKLLTDDATIALWNNQGLPADSTSVENGAILEHCDRWALMLDPQLQGITFVKNKFEELTVVRLGQKKMLDMLENAIRNGETVLIENIGESIDAVLNPILSRQVKKKGRELFVMLGDKEVEYDKKFKLILQTKLSNPHYKPEIQAETQLINFSVTEKGLEEQLLALVVKKERPDLEEQKAFLIRQQNEFKIELKKLEDSLLERLSNATGDILGDTELIENLERTKKTSVEIEEQVKKSRVTEREINAAREHYRPVASRGSLLYFLLDSLYKMEPMYQFSLNAFVVVFSRAIDQAQAEEDIEERVKILVEIVTLQVFNYARRGLFEKHKLIFAADLCFRILAERGDLDVTELDFFIRGRRPPQVPANPLGEWMTDDSWAAVQGLRSLEGFERLADDVESSAKRWREWSDMERPEREKLPQDWKNKTDFQKLLIVKAIRPDRVTHATRDFVAKYLGQEYVEQAPFSLEKTYFESSPSTPLFFILFPGADPVSEVETLGKKLGFTEQNGRFVNVSLGQGQESVAEKALANANEHGGWVMLQNIHLMNRWLPMLERLLESYGQDSHKDFRVFLSAEPGGTIPPSILQASIKITNEPPQTLKANLLRAYANFNQDSLESCMRQNDFKTILFALCFFHALILGRRRFGPIGWSRPYSFNMGDLTISANVLFNYLEANNVVPWEDLRYMFGEIMYGGHITDEWDRRSCMTYLQILMQEQLLEGMDLAPQFPSPPIGNYADYVKYIEEELPPENPPLFGLHSNAEINFLNAEADMLFRLLMEVSGAVSASGGETREEKAKQVIEDVLKELPERFDMEDMYARVEERTPYVSVVLQECDRMNILLSEIRSSLQNLEKGLLGELTISESMDRLLNSLFNDLIPETWNAVAYPSTKPLGMWFADLLRRVTQLADWSADLNLPKTVWISGLFNPMTFLTAIMQTTSRKNDMPIDQMCLQTEVTKKFAEDIGSAPREGAYIHGMFLEGCRWDTASGSLRDSYLKQLHPVVPVMFVRAIHIDKRDTKGMYECPVYKTPMRGPTYVTTMLLRTSDKPHKWVLAGVALLLSE